MPSSPTRAMIEPSTSKMRAQLSRIASNTGRVSATEPLIARSTSAVAVCCSSASLSSRVRSSTLPSRPCAHCALASATAACAASTESRSRSVSPKRPNAPSMSA